MKLTYMLILNGQDPTENTCVYQMGVHPDSRYPAVFDDNQQ